MLEPYLLSMASEWSLRHLRYFVAVAEEGSLTNAAERRLHTAQPSLSRQIRDLELEVGVELFVRSSRGIELTEAARVFWITCGWRCCRSTPPVKPRAGPPNPPRRHSFSDS